MEKKKIARYIARERLLGADSKAIVALSGGADSVALLLLLTELGYPCEAAHCNFHLRGEESDRDERFVHRLCEERRIPLHVAHFDTARHAAERVGRVKARENRAFFALFRDDRLHVHRDVGDAQGAAEKDD